MATRGPAISLADFGYRAKYALIADWDAMDDVPGETIGNDVRDRERQPIDMIDEDTPGIGVLGNPVARER